MKKLFCLIAQLTIIILLPNFALAVTIVDDVNDYPLSKTKCDTIDLDLSECKSESQRIYSSSTSHCQYYIFGSAIAYAAFLLLVAFFLRRASLVARRVLTVLCAVGFLFISMIGSGGTKVCYNDQDAIRGINLSICANNQAKIKKICEK